MNRLRQSRASRGSALMEYAVPAAIILLSAGVLATVTDVTGLMAEYFMSASGHTKSSLEGSTFKLHGLAEDAYGSPGNGLSGFSNFGGLADGSGAAVSSSGGGGMFYSGSTSRTGGRQQPSSPEYLFP